MITDDRNLGIPCTLVMSVTDLFIACVALRASVPDVGVTMVHKMTVISYPLCLSTFRVTLDTTI